MKIAIIGAGTNGLYLAWKLAKKGNEVTVFEKKTKIGKEVCSGLFSERILNFVPESQNLIQNEINYCLIHFPQKTIKIKFSRKFFVMSHYELDNLIFKLAQKEGVKFVLNSNIKILDIKDLENKFEKIIGCDGAISITRKSLNLPDPDFYLAIQGFLGKKDKSNFVETWPTKSGFVWKIPRGEKIEWGIIEKPNLAKKFFENFLEKNKILLKETKSAIVPQGLILSKNPKIALCGDAAGLTKPWSGGGVIWGLIGADLLLKNFPDFIKYQKELKKFFLFKIFLSKVAKKFVYFLGFNFSFLLPKEKKIEGDFIL